MIILYQASGLLTTWKLILKASSVDHAGNTNTILFNSQKQLSVHNLAL